MAALPAPGWAQSRDGTGLYKAHCRACHDRSAATAAPDFKALKELSPDAIVRALNDGSMRYQGLALSGAERRAVAEYISGRKIGGDLAGSGIGRCAAKPFGDPSRGPRWNGWSPDVTNTHFQPAKAAGLTADQVSRLELKWALGFPDTTSAWSQPTIVGGRVFVGSQAGVVYSLDAKTGCIYWTFTAESGVRSAVSIGRRRKTPKGDGSPYAAFFADMKGHVYAVTAATGKLLWRRKIDSHALVRLTGSPTLYGERVYVPVSSYEESQALGPTSKYPCCTFRGSIVALDAETGAIFWKAYTIRDEPRPIETKSDDEGRSNIQLFGPAGGAIWSAPTIDAKRRAIYVSVGNGYSAPQQATTDAVVAFDLATGEMRWAKQATPDDLYGCRPGSANCADERGADFDFGASPMLVGLPDGRDAIVVGQKSGVGYAMDPDREGDVLWQYRAGEGGGLGGIQWGTAADAGRAYFPVSDINESQPGGLHAVDLTSGERVWYAAPARSRCGASGRGCAQSAAITVMPGVVFSGSVDGMLRAFSTKSGAVLWEYDTNRPFETVNGVRAKGGSINGPAPTVAGGMLYVNSGYGAYGGYFGNVLLAFAP